MKGMDYTAVSDEELIARLRKGETQITDFIMEKYKNLVRKKAKAMFLIGGDNDDLIQEGMIGLFKAIRDYQPNKDSSFYSFANLCISRKMYTAVQASKRQKHIPLNTYVSLYSDGMSDNGEYGALIDTYPSKVNKSPEELFIDKETINALEEQIEKSLSEFEKQVLDLYLAGLSYAQMAKLLNKDEKSTDNAIQRIKTKIKKIMAE